MPKRQELPELPEAVFVEASQAHDQAVSFIVSIEQLGGRLDELRRFLKKVEKAYDDLSLKARAYIDPISGEEYGRLVFNADGTFTDPEANTRKQPDSAWLQQLRDSIKLLEEAHLRSPGRLELADNQVNMAGLRAFASVIERFWMSAPGRSWTTGSGSGLAAGDEPASSPAERFLHEHYSRIDPRVELKQARAVIKRPSSRTH